MLLEAITTGRLGPLDHSRRKHQYQSGRGYQTGVIVVIVRPNYVPVQPQVLIQMQQAYPYEQQQQQQQQPQMPAYPNPQEDVIQHHPQPPHVTLPSSSSKFFSFFIC